MSLICNKFASLGLLRVKLQLFYLIFRSSVKSSSYVIYQLVFIGKSLLKMQYGRIWCYPELFCGLHFLRVFCQMALLMVEITSIGGEITGELLPSPLGFKLSLNFIPRRATKFKLFWNLWLEKQKSLQHHMLCLPASHLWQEHLRLSKGFVAFIYTS